MASSQKLSGHLALAIGIAAVVGVTLWMLREPPPPAPPSPPPPFQVPVTVTPVQVGDVTESIVLAGDVRAPERAQLAFERAGRIHELPVQLGDVVAKGAVLARLDNTVMEHEVLASEAALAQAHEMAELALRDAERLKQAGDVVSSAAQLDRAEAMARNEAAKVMQMEADLALQRTRLAQGVLGAPFAAVVVARPVALGSYVAAGDPCFELLSLETREILVELPPRVAAGVLPGAVVTLTSDELAGFELTATLASVLPSQAIGARIFTGVVRLGEADDPERRLVPGMFVRARLELRAARAALTVPVDCLIEDAGGMRIAVVVPGEPPTAGAVPVRVLARDEERAAVAALGAARLAVGDAVILIGKENVVPGTLLAIAESSAGADGGEALGSR